MAFLTIEISFLNEIFQPRGKLSSEMSQRQNKTLVKVDSFFLLRTRARTRYEN